MATADKVVPTIASATTMYLATSTSLMPDVVDGRQELASTPESSAAPVPSGYRRRPQKASAGQGISTAMAAYMSARSSAVGAL